MRARVSARVLERWRLTLPLAVPTLGGLTYLAAFDAPARLIAINAAALVLALAWTIWGRWPAKPAASVAIATIAAGLLLLPMLTGPDLGGVARWFPAGPVTLHSGPLLLPLIVVLAARVRRSGPAILALAGAALALQPDAAGLAGLAAAGGVLAAIHRSLAFVLVTAGAAALALFTVHAGTLEPQVFTEGVLAQVAGQSWIAASALAVALFLAPPFLLPMPAETRPLAALLVALGAMAIVAPFPFPLIGYGAAPILGFGLALGVTGKAVQK